MSQRITWKTALQRLHGNDLRILRNGIRILAGSKVARHPSTLRGQPFDAHLLRASRLFLRSRQMYLKQDGRFYPTLVSSPRTLTSASLLEQEIEYTPIERELIWAATDPIESANPKTLSRLLQTRNYCTSIFHEQNHRILWKFLPPPSRSANEVTHYLNFVESLVVTLDSALGDELGHGVSRVFHLSGLTYDPGTDILFERPSKRTYRNYLQGILYTTYLKLEFYDEADIRKAVHALFSADRKLTERAIRRALRLDDAFVQLTNPHWQKIHIPALIKKIGVKSPRALVLPTDPLQNHVHYLWAERWFDLMGV
jgi:hypothetical protein